MPLRDRLTTLAEKYELPLGAADKLERLVSALAAEPNPPTTVREAATAVDQHIADSLSALVLEKVRRAAVIVDIGAGAGFPGLPLAAALASAAVDLVESNRRKCDVIERLARAAGLANARAIARRAEEWALADGRAAYDLAAARALAPLPVLVEYAAPMLAEGGALVAWKGARDPVEEAAGAEAAEVVGLQPGRVVPVFPFEGARARNLYLYLKDRPTPERFPRRPGMATKRPLA